MVSPNISNNSRTAFIIDDDHLYVYGMKKLLEYQSLCSKLTVFHNAKTAIAYLKTHRYQLELLPDVILLDINMPVMNGWQFLEAFSQINSDFLSRIRIYMLSSSISSQDARQAQACELLSGYMSKPITLPQLQEIFQP